jgi:hypothetical protein
MGRCPSPPVPARGSCRHAEPLIDPRFFRSAPFSGASLMAITAFTALGGFLFITDLYLQGDRGLSAAETASTRCDWRRPRSWPRHCPGGSSAGAAHGSR